jgi:hypothetical protein
MNIIIQLCIFELKLIVNNFNSGCVKMFRIRNIKKFTALIAVLTLIYNSSGYVITYQALIQFTKNYIHSAIERKEIDEEIILLSFKKSDIDEDKIDFKWKHEKEFKYNGGMYDIADRFETEDSIHFYCFYDHKENKLEENFNKHFEKDKEDKKHNSSSRILLSQLTDQYIISEYIFNYQNSELIYSNYIDTGYSVNELDVPSPPPKLSLSS